MVEGLIVLEGRDPQANEGLAGGSAEPMKLLRLSSPEASASAVVSVRVLRAGPRKPNQYGKRTKPVCFSAVGSFPRNKNEKSYSFRRFGRGLYGVADPVGLVLRNNGI